MKKLKQLAGSLKSFLSAPAPANVPVKPSSPTQLSLLRKALNAEQKIREDLELRVAELDAVVAALKGEIQALKASNNNSVVRREFIKKYSHPNLLKHSEVVPETIRENSAKVTSLISPLNPYSYDALCDGENLKGGERWALYWLLANAARNAAKVTTTRNEDGGSTEFSIEVETLASSFKEKGLLGQNTHISVQRIYENRSGALQEKEVGADLLLVVVGESLIGKAGFRLFWLQAKRPDTTTFVLNYWRKTENDGGLRQLKALAAVNHPEKGSFGLYLQYLQELKSTYALMVDKISTPYGDSEAACDVNLEPDGCRAQELLWQMATNASAGVFETVDEVIKFLSAQTTQPRKVLALAPETDAFALNLVKQLDERSRSVKLTKSNSRTEAPGRGAGLGG
jgi:uncharacterized small protein (DUF1192 family)